MAATTVNPQIMDMVLRFRAEFENLSAVERNVKIAEMKAQAAVTKQNAISDANAGRTKAKNEVGFRQDEALRKSRQESRTKELAEINDFRTIKTSHEVQA